MKIEGIIPALCTPTDENEKVNEKSLRKLIDYTLENGCHGIFVLSSTGEFFGLSEEEKIRAIKITVNQVNGRVPVMVGAYGISTREAIRMVKIAEENGADAVSVLTPMMITPNDEEIYQHYKAIANSTKMQVTLYNNPDRTKVNISADVVKRLSEIKNIVAIKDSSGNFSLTMEYIMKTKGTQVKVLCGRDLLIYATLMHGGVGAVVATANVIPKLVVDLYNDFLEKKYDKALEKQYKLTPFRMAFNLASWPAVTKDALNLLGFNVGKPILPITGCSNENSNKLKKILEDLKMI